ncbi:hypothetical protein Fmac_003444 [Flemingia macrophylla]|uniref:Uncharacterized protein n=1 Tax=Flemingia macrophylla TaxID=520843 RepID=A0ABD1NMT3_9FABA
MFPIMDKPLMLPPKATHNIPLLSARHHGRGFGGGGTVDEAVREFVVEAASGLDRKQQQPPPAQAQ